MIIDISSSSKITKVPHCDTFSLIQKRLSVSDFDNIVNEINRLIDEAGGEIATAGWLPGSDWSDTPFQCIYDTAARKNKDLSARMFGLMVWYTVMNRPERWGSGKYDVDGREIGSHRYFRLGD